MRSTVTDLHRFTLNRTPDQAPLVALTTAAIREAFLPVDSPALAVAASMVVADFMLAVLVVVFMAVAGTVDGTHVNRSFRESIDREEYYAAQNFDFC